MNQPYFVLELAHSIHGQFKRIHLTHRSLKVLVFSAAAFVLLIVGLISTCILLSCRISQYQRVQADLDHLRNRYQRLQQVANQRGVQIASLESLATEVSSAYGFRRETAPESDVPVPGVTESIQQFNLLKAANYSSLYHRYAYQWQQHTQPSGWPVTGVLRSSFGERSDPFSGEGEFHTGIDLSAPTGTAVHATADGVVVRAGWDGSYGNLVAIDHGHGVQTYYAHLSHLLVVSGEEVRLGQVVALSGGTGRATSPHLHYEVRVAGTPVNPYRYLGKAEVAQAARAQHDDLGL